MPGVIRSVFFSHFVQGVIKVICTFKYIFQPLCAKCDYINFQSFRARFDYIFQPLFVGWDLKIFKALCIRCVHKFSALCANCLWLTSNHFMKNVVQLIQSQFIEFIISFQSGRPRWCFLKNIDPEFWCTLCTKKLKTEKENKTIHEQPEIQAGVTQR